MAANTPQDTLDEIINDFSEELLLEEIRTLNETVQTQQRLQRSISDLVDKTRAYADVPASDLDAANEKLAEITQLLAAAVNLERSCRKRSA